MPNTTTIARPYAKAIFEYARDTENLGHWSAILQVLAVAVSDEKAKQFISNPAVTNDQMRELLMSVVKCSAKEKEAVENFVSLLAQNKRLLILPDLKVLFDSLRAEQEKTLEVRVLSFAELSTAQQKQLISSLSKRVQREVTLSISIDKSLLGGAVIYADDLIIDGSVRGKLTKLRTDIAA